MAISGLRLLIQSFTPVSSCCIRTPWETGVEFGQDLGDGASLPTWTLGKVGAFG
jgi:hypothetical protein